MRRKYKVLNHVVAIRSYRAGDSTIRYLVTHKSNGINVTHPVAILSKEAAKKYAHALVEELLERELQRVHEENKSRDDS